LTAFRSASRLLAGLCLSVAVLLSPLAATADPGVAPKTQLTLLSYNIFYAERFLRTMVNTKQGFAQTVKVMQASNADIIAVSEVRRETGNYPYGPRRTGSIAPDLAAALGYEYFDQSDYYEDDLARTDDHPAIWANAILSRYPIVATSPSGLSATIDVDGRLVQVFSLNLDWKPYVPYQLVGIDYYGYPTIHTEEEALFYADLVHGAALKEVEAEIDDIEDDVDAIFIMGDFNEPSHLDWTPQQTVAEGGYQPIAVAWPFSSRLEKLGFVDAYRAAYPDVAAYPGYTWTNTTALDDPDDHHDRIDFIFGRADDLEVTESLILGENAENADVVIEPWPSDHRAVSAKVEF